MRMRIRYSSYFLIFFLFVALYGIIESLRFHSVAAMALPLALSAIMFVLAAIELTRELYSKDGAQITTQEEPGKEAKTALEFRRFNSAMGSILGFSLGIYLLGFVIGIPLLVFSYLKLNGRGWLIAICFSILTTLFIYATFEAALKVPLYRGLIWELIFS